MEHLPAVVIGRRSQRALFCTKTPRITTSHWHFAVAQLFDNTSSNIQYIGLRTFILYDRWQQ